MAINKVTTKNVGQNELTKLCEQINQNLCVVEKPVFDSLGCAAQKKHLFFVKNGLDIKLRSLILLKIFDK